MNESLIYAIWVVLCGSSGLIIGLLLDIRQKLKDLEK